MKLSLKQLQKLCKKNKYKIKDKATKMDMINTILAFNKTKQAKKNKKKRQLTPMKKAEYLTSGYVRNSINSIAKDKYDHQLSILVGNYIGSNLFLCFDTFHPKYAETIKSNGRVLERGVYNFKPSNKRRVKQIKPGGSKMIINPKKYTENNVRILYGSSMEMNQGIYEWEIKVIKYSTSITRNASNFDAFGVTNKIDLCYKENLWGVKEHGQIFAFDFTDAGRNEIIKEKDVIKCILDCHLDESNMWTLRYQVNGKSLSEMSRTNQNQGGFGYNTAIKLKPNCKYYPVILSKRNKTKYKLLMNY